MNILKRIFHPKDWLLEKDIHDMEIEIELMEKQLPSLRRKLELAKRKLAEYNR